MITEVAVRPVKNNNSEMALNAETEKEKHHGKFSPLEMSKMG